jgi:hypothetical protein
VETVLRARNLHVSHSDLAAHVMTYSLPPVNPAITEGAPPVNDAALALTDAEDQPPGADDRLYRRLSPDDDRLPRRDSVAALAAQGPAPEGRQPGMAD